MTSTEPAVKLEDRLQQIEEAISEAVEFVSRAEDCRDRLISERDKIRKAIIIRDWRPNATITSDCPNPHTYGADLAYGEGDRVYVHSNGTTTRKDGESFLSWVTEGRVRLDDNS